MKTRHKRSCIYCFNFTHGKNWCKFHKAFIKDFWTAKICKYYNQENKMRIVKENKSMYYAIEEGLYINYWHGIISISHAVPEGASMKPFTKVKIQGGNR